MSEKHIKFKEQLNELIQTGYLLDGSIKYEFYKDDITLQLEKLYGKEKAQEYLQNLPKFKEKYQSWYSESLALVKQVLPDRVDDFISYYEYPRARKDITFENYTIRDYLQGLVIRRHEKIIVDGSASIPEFAQQLNIVKAAKELLESSLVNLTSILQADLFDSEIDSARALAKSGFLRAAGAICGVVIEKHLKHVCSIHHIIMRKKRPVISDFNNNLKKNDIISVPQWRFIQHLSDLRNICDHAREREPSTEELEKLISGTEEVLKTVY